MRRAFALMLGAALAGCTGWAALTPQPEDGQQLLVAQATPILVSTKRFEVGVVPVVQFPYTGTATFTLAFTNGSEGAVDFGPENLHVSVEGRPARLLSHDEHVAEPSHDQDWERYQLYIEATRSQREAAAAAAPSGANPNRILHWMAVLQHMTLRPGEVIVGDVKAELPKPMLWNRPVRIDVEVEGERHSFEFRYAAGPKGTVAASAPAALAQPAS